MSPPVHLREALREAAQWLALIDSDTISEADLAGLEQWRDQSAVHEAAWQQALHLRERFSGLPASLAMATLDRPDQSRRTALGQMLGLAALAPMAWWVSRELPLEAWTADLRTGVGERRVITLEDGATVQLNTDSAVDVDAVNHRVWLRRGEISVNTPGLQPLAIQVPSGQVTLGGAALGPGQVCVRLIESGCQVAVVQGRADVQPSGGDRLRLDAGQQADLMPSGIRNVGLFEAWRLGWRDGVLRLDDQRLGDLLVELSRYRPGVLRWDPALDRLRVTGTFRLDDTDQALTLLAASLPVQVVARTRYWITLLPRATTA
ncbi:FecR domain-containing protein [Pseudomonas sp. URMO17WK12:I11]|uniref:FecR domain-containing protein n=1 Tax=Pseudomonas sp. URMO17WK12:I11 TaxID=1283291 RepID=UPI0011A699E8|nr:FecR domain-containing protein [Pseudomonas sp. URMO17WK12:I11]